MAFYRASIGGGGVTPTSITPSDSSPVQMTIDNSYSVTRAGYAIEHSPTSLTPSNSNPATISSGTIYKASAGGKAVASVTDVTPSDSSPVSLTSGTIYKMGGAGYAIESQPSSKTPDDTTPPSVSSGEIVKMGGAGYLYATQQTETETTLWTNASPTSNFAAQAVSLSDDYTNYKKIRFYYRATTTDATETYIEYDKSVIDTWYQQGGTLSGNQNIGSITLIVGASGHTRQIRRAANGATDAFNFTVAYRLNAQASIQNGGIPTKITGLQH